MGSNGNTGERLFEKDFEGTATFVHFSIREMRRVPRLTHARLDSFVGT